MISLILPYWDRQKAADKALHLLAQHYQGLDLEVIVVDDGNRIPFVCPDVPLNIRVVRLPEKAEPTPQSVAWNAGVEAANGEIVCLSCVEILHEAPILEQMARQLAGLGIYGYVLASAWCPEHKEWHCHSTKRVDYCPEGTGAAFCSMLYRGTFYLAGGFDEDYQKGAGFEDKDFIHRMLSIGAKFKIRDDLKVIHPKTGARIKWESDGFRRNEAIFLHKWPEAKVEPVTVLCLKAGTAYGPEYVNILFDMVRRNLRAGYPGRFVCLTDDPTGLDDGIETLPLPGDLETWWGKLYMFKAGLFPDRERVVFMDLDTLIIGDIEPLMNYRGEFATLKDFYFPHQVGPAIIAWKAGGVASSIWEEWDAQGRPRAPGGDLVWINNLDQGHFVRRIDKLQDLLPGYFCSFKADCHPYPAKGVKVVCFHGQPKPDNCATEWVAETWKIGGGGFADLAAVANTGQAIVARNVKASCARDLPWLKIKPAHEGQVVIVAGGPSLKGTLPEIEWRRSLQQDVIAVNGSARWLNEHGIIPDIHVIIDARPDNARFISESTAARRFLASQCAPETFDAAKTSTVFHMNTLGIVDALPTDREAHLISSGTTVGLAAMAIAYTQGYRVMHLHGFDSSYEGGHHAYEQPQNDADQAIEVSVNGRKFRAAGWMVKQAQEFQVLALQLAEAGVTITVAGDGLLPFIAKCMMDKGGAACH